MKTDPWPHLAIEDFLDSNRWNDIRQLAKQEHAVFRNFGYNTRSGHYVRYLDEDICPEANRYFKEFTTHREYTNLKKIIHWSFHPPDWEYPWHIDADPRIYTATLYVSPEENGGTVLSQDKIDTTEVEWKPNKLFVHCSSKEKSTWHKYYSTTQRCTLNMFFVDPDRLPKDRQDINFLIDVKEI